MNLNHEYSREEILKLVKSLKLTGMMESYDEVVADTIRRNAPSSYCLPELLKAEVKTRTLKALQARLRGAHFPALKDLDNFIFTDTPIQSEQALQLYTAEFVTTSRNILLVGGPDPVTFYYTSLHVE